LIKTLKILLFLIIVSLQLNAQQLTPASAKIIVDSYSLEKSRSVPIGILIDLEKDWHIYWRNPGDSGMPTAIDFEIPEGVSISEIEWLVPNVFEYEGLASYGYDGQILLIAELNVPESFVSNSITVSAKIKSLICKDVCIPFNTNVSKKIKLTNSFSAEEEISKLFAQTRKSLPEAINDFELSIISDEDNITVVIQNLNSEITKIKSLYFLPYENGIFKNTAEQNFKIKDDKIELMLEYDQFKTEELSELYGILVFHLTDAPQPQRAYEIKKQINTN
jgi:DsbC/DsbD-like thiol-disulfide interchange protein